MQSSLDPAFCDICDKQVVRNVKIIDTVGTIIDTDQNILICHSVSRFETVTVKTASNISFPLKSACCFYSYFTPTAHRVILMRSGLVIS